MTENTNSFAAKLGPLSTIVKSNAKWTRAYPASQRDADEFEALLEFVKACAQWDNYVGALQGPNNQRDSALMELRVAAHLMRHRFTIVEWKPKGADRNEGEFLVEGADKERVFVEVKSPGWEGEHSPEELKAGRRSQPKYIDGEGGATAPWKKLREAIDKAYKKFRDDTPNLLVVADDLHISLSHAPEIHAGQALYSRLRTSPGYFTDSRYERLGGVGVFWIELNEQELDYRMRLFLNPNCLETTALPKDMRAEFRGEVVQSEGPTMKQEPSLFERFVGGASSVG